MARPSKPASVLKAEGKSHRTKKELEAREKAEQAILSGVALSERVNVKKDKVAHNEFLRVKKLLDKIEKADGLYTALINRYCEIYSESLKLKEQHNKIWEFLNRFDEKLNSEDLNLEDKEHQKLLKLYIDLLRQANGVDINISQKRKELLTIEKESCMTVAAALRTIPKAVDTIDEAEALKAALADDD